MRDTTMTNDDIEYHCFVTGEVIPTDGDGRFTYEFDAWVSKDGQKLIDEWVESGMQTENAEFDLIYAEWYAQDEADAARWDEAMGIDDRDEDNY